MRAISGLAFVLIGLAIAGSILLAKNFFLKQSPQGEWHVCGIIKVEDCRYIQKDYCYIPRRTCPDTAPKGCYAPDWEYYGACFLWDDWNCDVNELENEPYTACYVNRDCELYWCAKSSGYSQLIFVGLEYCTRAKDDCCVDEDCPSYCSDKKLYTNGKCSEVGGPCSYTITSVECCVDADCGAGKYCSDYRCVSYENCNAKDKTYCKDDRTVRIEDWRCKPGYGTDTSCRSGYCEMYVSEYTCSPNTHCVNGVCVEYGKENCNARDTSSCSNKALTITDYYCEPNYGTDESCQEGHCKSKIATTPVQCCANADCPSGYVCENYVCKSTIVCGNGICESGESFLTCPSDCPPGPEIIIPIVATIALVVIWRIRKMRK